MALTLDVWNMPTESAKRVGHPAPFPVELPEQLIRLYTYKNDLVLDPFLGSGSTAVAAAALGRRYVGYDLDPAYVEIARSRVAELDGQATEPPPTSPPPKTATALDDPAPDGKQGHQGQRLPGPLREGWRDRELSSAAPCQGSKTLSGAHGPRVPDPPGDRAMSNVMTYKGYSARIEYDDEDGILFGQIAGIRDGVGFHADTV